MGTGLLIYESAIVFQHLHDAFIGVFHILTFEICDLLSELSALVYRADNFPIFCDHVVCQTNPVIILQEHTAHVTSK